MASCAFALAPSVNILSFRLPSANISIASSSSSKWSSPSAICFRNGETESLYCESGELSNSARFDRRLITLHSDRGVARQGFHSAHQWQKTRSIRWSVVQAVTTGTAESAETEESGESTSELVDKLLYLVKDSDRGALLGPEAQANVASAVGQLEKIGMPEPLKSPLIFGDWNVAYSSNPTSPGGGYRTWLGRLVFRTRDMIQSILEPDGVVNIVRFALFGFIGGQVTLKGKLTPLDSKLIQVDFKPPNLQIGPFKFSYGGTSMVKISITYLDEDIRLGRGSRGTVFVFTRR
ncbi:hypothetical protein R1sor_020711 [Riccia sorocarpa]|uniref:Plastid lipid-associated protein/fibrillin conserved domain-containing protein n=1 Tax=Riccia sorocarpa TaxID=122646 RepID=A0ABD3GIA0_9MARC